MENAMELMKLELGIEAEMRREGLARCQERVQAVADATPRTGSDGLPLTKCRKQDVLVRTVFGEAKVTAWCGRCRKSGEWEVPFKERFFRGERSALSPSLEHKILATCCETGSFEKCAKVCAEWGCPLSDDKAMDTSRRVGESCSDSDLPEFCDSAAGKNDVLICMMDGWMARFMGENWGKDRSLTLENRSQWHEIRSGVMFKLSEAVDISRNRRIIISKHIVCAPPGESPEEFGRRMEREAKRMGLERAKKAYFIMDGQVCLWSIYEESFNVLAEGTLDYYHAVQHLAALAEHLFPDKSEEGKRGDWLSSMKTSLKTIGPKELIQAIAEAEKKRLPDEDRRIVERECAYFTRHEDHMHYDRNAERGVPIGSGAMESQCSQNQNRFKRRGQFWSEDGFAAFIKVYVRYTNNELDYCYAHAA